MKWAVLMLLALACSGCVMLQEATTGFVTGFAEAAGESAAAGLGE